MDEHGGDDAFDRYIMDEDAKAALEAEMTLTEWATEFFKMSTVSPRCWESGGNPPFLTCSIGT